MLRFLVIFVCCWGVQSAAGQMTNNEDFELVSVCTQFEGYTYYTSGSLLKTDQTGWHQDKMSKFSVLLVQWADSREHDLFYIGPMSGGKIMPYTWDGADVTFLNRVDSNGYIFYATYQQPNVSQITTFHFDLNAKNNGRLLYTHQRRNGLINNMYAMTGLCVGKETAKLLSEE